MDRGWLWKRERKVKVEDVCPLRANCQQEEMFNTQSQVMRFRRGHLRAASKLQASQKSGKTEQETHVAADGGRGWRSATSKGNWRPRNRREQCTASGPVEKDEPLLWEQFGDCPISLNPRGYSWTPWYVCICPWQHSSHA